MGRKGPGLDSRSRCADGSAPEQMGDPDPSRHPDRGKTWGSSRQALQLIGRRRERGAPTANAIQLLRWRTALGLDDPVPFLLEEAAEDSRHPVHDEDVAELYQASDAVLMTNASEGLRLPCWQLRQPGPDYDLPGLPRDRRADSHTFPVDRRSNTLAAVLEGS